MVAFSQYISAATTEATCNFYIPATGSASFTCQMEFLHVSYNDYIAEIITDELWKRRQRRLRFAPFSIKPTALYHSKPLMKKPVLRQVMPRMVRIGRGRT